jgi:uncharacterized protein (UPF0128 family)
MLGWLKLWGYGLVLWQNKGKRLSFWSVVKEKEEKDEDVVVVGYNTFKFANEITDENQ